jgi:hypothetical protein
MAVASADDFGPDRSVQAVLDDRVPRTPWQAR